MKRAWILSVVLLATGVMLAQQPATVVPNEALIVDGVPPIPASIAERADAYTNYRMANIFDWHPQRREMLIGTRFADTTQVHRVRMPGGAREQVTFFPDRMGSAMYQPHTGNYFVFSKDTEVANGTSCSVSTSPPAWSHCSPTANRAIWAQCSPTRATA